MTWLLLALASGLIWAIANIIDKFNITKKLPSPYLASFITGVTIFIIFAVTSISQGLIVLTPGLILIAFLAGATHQIGIFFYYLVIKKEEVSRAVPLLDTTPIFAIILAYFILGETFNYTTYLGIFLIVIGTLLISLKKIKGVFKFSSIIYLVLVSAFSFAFKNILIKYVSFTFPIIEVLLWIGIGNLLVALLLFIFSKPSLKGRNKEQGVVNYIIIGTLDALGLIFLFLALSHGTVTLVSAFNKLQVVFVFLIATFLSYFFPKIIKERLTKFDIIQKIIAIIIILCGTFLIF